MRPPEMRRFVVLFEPEAACRDRLTAGGMSAQAAAEVAFYLAQATDFTALVESVAAAFAASRVDVVCLPLDPPQAWLPLLTGPDRRHTLVWCLTDGFAFYRGSFVASVAALLDVAQLGSPPEAQHLCQDKFRCLALARALGVRTPATVLVSNGEPLSPVEVLPEGTPLFVKPATLGGKIGIDGDSLAPDLPCALELTRRIHARYGDRALIQSYVPGRDVRVSFMDLGRPEAPLGIYGVATGARHGFPTLADSRRITQLRAAGPTLALQDLRGEPALAASVAAIEEAARRIARVVPLRDYFSLDFRLDETGAPWFLEFEVCPAVTIYDFLTYLRDVHGTDLPEALVRAVPLAFARRKADAGLG
jgi:D-alanine-D-alanine ligase